MEKIEHWEYQILDANPPSSQLGMCALVDIDSDGLQEIVVGGLNGLFWYKYPRGENHPISRCDHRGVGITSCDVDGDGYLDVVATGRQPFRIVWYENPRDLHKAWKCHEIDVKRGGHGHDMVFSDIDGDGKNELVANSVVERAIYWYKVPEDPAESPWPKRLIYSGVLSEGLAVADINGDGRLDVIAGPDWYEAPKNLENGQWKRHVIAGGFRERCRLAVGDVNRDGRPDALIVEGEYSNGKWALFENVDGGRNWRKRLLEENVLSNALYYAHSVLLEDIDGDGDLDILLGEMGLGGGSPPRNIRAKVLVYENLDGIGRKWKRHLINQGPGTHEAKIGDVDGDGEAEIIGKSWKEPCVVQVWDRRTGPAPFQMKHKFIDRNKETRAIEILPVDIDGDGLQDVVCGNVWYRNPDWKKHKLPLGQAIAVYDISGNGRPDIIGVKKQKPPFSSELYWLEAPEDPFSAEWEPHYIGTGDGDWPHAATVGSILSDGRIALAVSYHGSKKSAGFPPQYFEVPADPKQPWRKKKLADIQYGEEMVIADVNGDGQPEIVAGPYYLVRKGDSWIVHQIADPENYGKIARVRAVDMNQNGRVDVVVCEENIDWATKTVGLGRVAWFEAPPNPATGEWVEHVVSVMRCPHSLDVSDLNGDGVMEIVAAEHDPFMAYDANTFCRLCVYSRFDKAGTVWVEHLIDSRYEHHDGSHVIRLDQQGTLGIVSHGWVEDNYLHLWML